MKTTPKILVLEGQWVLCGDVLMSPKEPKGSALVRVYDAHVIRVWGTTDGLGQLALHGKQVDTVLDLCGVADIPKGKILYTMDCASRFWA